MSAAVAARLAGRLARGRAAAEARMESTAEGSVGVVRRNVGRGPQDDDGIEPTLWATVHEGPCRLGASNRGSASTTRVQAPGGESQQAPRTAHWPVATTGIDDGDVIEILAGRHAGTFWRVIESDGADQQTALRLPVQAMQEPPDWGTP